MLYNIGSLVRGHHRYNVMIEIRMACLSNIYEEMVPVTCLLQEIPIHNGMC